MLRLLMKWNFVLTQRKRTVLFYSMVIFLLQSLAPAFQGVMAKSANGYIDTYCTMNGAVTVFVEFEDGQSGDAPRCYECVACVLQANLDAQPVAHLYRLEGCYLADSDKVAGPAHPVDNPPPYAHFQSRAPPA